MYEIYDRLTEKAIKVILLAQEEARRLGCKFVDTEHILLGLIGEGTGIAARSLKSMGVNLRSARIEVEKITGSSIRYNAITALFSGALPALEYAPGAKQVLKLSLGAAQELNHDSIGPEHLLLGLIKEGNGLAGDVMLKLGIDAGELHQRVLESIAEEYC